MKAPEQRDVYIFIHRGEGKKREQFIENTVTTVQKRVQGTHRLNLSALRSGNPLF